MEPIVKADELFDLSGEVALVTGASSGLGARFARVLAAHGAKVAMAARRRDRLAELADAIAAEGGAALPVTFDVRQSDDAGALFKEVEAAFGSVTILVNNAGIVKSAPALETGPDAWREVIDVNLNAVWFLAQEAARRMIAAGRAGTIINIASLLSLRISKGTAAYNVAKAGVQHLTRQLAVELARHGIRVNALAPGYVVTEMTEDFLASPGGQAMLKSIPQRRFAQSADLDGAMLLLASAKASGFMTGATVVVDGGQMWSLS